METKGTYDVLRFVEHHQICHISSDVVEGYPFMQWLKYHYEIPKEKFFYWIESLRRQLSAYYRCRGVTYYQYVNPYALVITDDDKLHLLDLRAESNEKQLRKMQRRTVRAHFLPPDEQYYQNSSEKLDIYGLGKTIQYILATIELTPGLTRLEERKLQTIISRCLNQNSKKSFRNISEIQKQFSKFKKEQKEQKKQNKRGTKVAVACIAIGISVFAAQKIKDPTADTRGNQLTEPVVEAKETEQAKDTQGEEEKQLYEELGLVYFQKFQDYERSKAYFERIKRDERAELMMQLSDCLSQETIFETSVREILKQLELYVGEEKAVYYSVLFQGYTYLTSQEDKEQLLRLGKQCLDLVEGEEAAAIETKMAAVYEETGKLDEAIAFYAKKLAEEKEKVARENLYLKMGSLMVENNEKEEAFQIMREGIQEFPKSVELRNQYIQTQGKDQSIDRESFIQILNGQIKECNELKESDEFLKFLKEKGLKLKGGKVCERQELK